MRHAVVLVATSHRGIHSDSALPNPDYSVRHEKGVGFPAGERPAWQLVVPAGGKPGIDGQTFADIIKYGSMKWMDELAEVLRTKTYQPQPVRRVYIRKESFACIHCIGHVH